MIKKTYIYKDKQCITVDKKTWIQLKKLKKQLKLKRIDLVIDYLLNKYLLNKKENNGIPKKEPEYWKLQRGE